MSNAPRERGLSKSQLVTRFIAFATIAGVITAFAVLPVVGTVGLMTRNGVRDFQNLPSDLTQVPLPQQNTIVDIHGKVIATLFAENRIEVPIEKISPLLQQAAISIEDQRFMQHAGIDLRGTLRAALSTGSGSQVQGGSTITQQYVKQILFTAATSQAEREAATSRSLSRKIREARYALAIENKLSKKQILEGYLNIAYFGAGSYGAEIASRRYFSRSAKDLTLTQAATLAGLVQNPSRYDPTRFPEAATNRRNDVLQAMVHAGYITQDIATKAQAVSIEADLKPEVLPNGCTTSIAPYFCDYVVTELKTNKVFGATPEARAHLLDIGGLVIHTSLDLTAQASAQKAVDDRIPATDPSGKAAGITMIRPGTGEIVAMAQDRTWGVGTGKTTVNYNAPLDHNGTVGFQAGSTFKSFTLAAALDQGQNPYTVINAPHEKVFTKFRDCKTGAQLAPYDVKNSTASGAFNMLSGAAYSVNTFFVGLEEKIGLCGAPGMAKAMGVKGGNGKDFATYPCFTLGCFDVTTRDMAVAMATFSAHGMHCNPIAINKIIDRFGKELPVPTAHCSRMMSVKVADSVTAILAGVIDGPLNGRTGRVMYFGRPAAGKTGTTDSSAAVWFVGYTPDLAAATWVGDPRGGQSHPMKNIVINGVYYSQVFGSLMPGPIWREAMKGALATTPATAWKLDTLYGLNAGGFGNDTGAHIGSSDPCVDLTGVDLQVCRAANPSPSATPSVLPTVKPTAKPSKKPTTTPTTSAPTAPASPTP